MVFNPETGEHTEVDTQKEALDIAASIAVKFYMNHSSSNPINVLTTNDDNTISMSSLDGEIIHKNINPLVEAEFVKMIPVSYL